jgi:putative hydrolase of the HAD superfamily
MATMPLILFDLDNTLLDRDAAFRAAAAAFLAAHDLPVEDLKWMTDPGASGYPSRAAMFTSVTARYSACVRPEDVREFTEFGIVEHVRLTEPTAQALTAAREAGWRLAIVTNGPGPQQHAKICNTGLDDLVDGWVISGEYGVEKPDPRICRAAARAAGTHLCDTWMIGDSPHLDIAGAHGLGLRSVWVADGAWPTELGFHPTHCARDAAAAAHLVLSS